jgi:hypothetical protein
MKIATVGTCINFQIIETEEGTHALRCSSTGLTFPIKTDAEGGLILPEAVTFEETTKTTTATA